MSRKASQQPVSNGRYHLISPEDPQYINLSYHHWVILDEDRNLTSVLSALWFVSNGRVIVNTGAGNPDREPWFETSLSHLNQLTLGLTEKTISGHIQTLVDKGFLTVMEPPNGQRGKIRRYLLNYYAINAAVREFFSIGKTTDGGISVDGSFTDEPHVKLPMAIGKTTDAYKEERILKESTKEESQDQPFSPSNQSQNPNPLLSEELPLAEENPLSAPASPCDTKYSETQSTSVYELRDDLDASKFVEWVYGKRMGRKMGGSTKNVTGKLSTQANASIRFVIEEFERNLSPKDFRTALWNYLDSGDDFIRTAKWPLRLFLSDPMKYLSDTSTSPATQSPRPLPPSASSEAPANVPAPFSDPLKNPLTFLEQWNTIVYDSPVDVDSIPSFTMAGLKKAINGGDFQKCFERVYEKCQRINANKPGTVTFDGLFMGFVPMWQEIYAGKHDWKMGKEDPFASVLAAAEREERGGV